MALRDCISVREHQRDTSAVIRSMLVLVYYDKAGSCHGIIRNALLGWEQSFRDLGELVLALDEFCQKFDHERDALEDVSLLEAPALDGPAGCADDILSIVIERRDYGTIQGRVRGRITDGQSVRFPSALALIRLLSGGRREEQIHGS